MSWKHLALAALISFALTSSVHAGVLQAPTDNTPSGGEDLTGYSVKYVFGGVVYSTGAAAVTVHCTNVGSIDTRFAVEFFDQDGNFVVDGSFSLPSEQSDTISTNGTFYSERDLITPVINPIGSGRVLALDKKASLLCGAYVTEPGTGGTPPTFMSTIPMVPVGKPPKIKISKK